MGVAQREGDQKRQRRARTRHGTKRSAGPGHRRADSQQQAAKGLGVGRRLDIVASCIESSVPKEVYAVSLGGFDTSSSRKGVRSALFGEVGDGIAALLQRISASGRTLVGRWGF